MEELLESHPIIAGKHCMRWDLVKKKEGQYQNRFFDEFGVEWEESIQGMRGAVCSHPLADFSKIRTYQFPELPRFDPEAELLSWHSGKQTVSSPQPACPTDIHSCA